MTDDKKTIDEFHIDSEDEKSGSDFSSFKDAPASDEFARTSWPLGLNKDDVNEIRKDNYIEGDVSTTMDACAVPRKEIPISCQHPEAENYVLGITEDIRFFRNFKIGKQSENV
jgi:hypothetical protein